MPAARGGRALALDEKSYGPDHPLTEQCPPQTSRPAISWLASPTSPTAGTRRKRWMSGRLPLARGSVVGALEVIAEVKRKPDRDVARQARAPNQPAWLRRWVGLRRPSHPMRAMFVIGPGCVKTLRGMKAP
jgi:hypothetical protein